MKTNLTSCMATMAGAAVTAMTLWVGSAEAATTLTYATYFNANDPLVQVDMWFMKEVEQRSGGEITFEQYLGGTMLGGPEIYPGLSRGAVDMGMSVPAAFQPTEYVLTNVTLPYTTEDSVATTYAFNQLAAENTAVRQEYESRNVKLLYALGFSENAIWSNKAVRTLEDLEGMRIRAVMSVANALDLLGAVPVSMGFSDAVSALQRSVLDGISSAPFLTTMAYGVHEFVPFVSDGGGMGVYAVSSTGISMESWSRLTPVQQVLFETVAKEVPDYYATLMGEMVSADVDRLHGAGVTEVIVMSEDERNRVHDIVAVPLMDAWLKAVNESGVDGQAVLDRYRTLVAENESKRDYVPGLELYMQRYGKE